MENLPNLIGMEWHGGYPYNRFSDGRLLPVVRGGDGPNDPPADPPPPNDPPADPPAPKTFTQEQVTAMLAAEKAQGQRAAERTMLEGLGVTDAAEAKRILDAHREAERQRLSDTERAQQDAQNAKAQADADRAAAAAERKAAAIERQLVRAGLQLPEDASAAETALAKAVRLVELDGEATPDAVKAAVNETKAQFAALFTPAAGNGTTGGDPKGRGTRSNGAPTGVEAGRERARKEAEARAQRGNPLDRFTVVGR